MKNHFIVFKKVIGTILAFMTVTSLVTAQDVGVATFVSPGASTRSGSSNVVVRLQNFDTLSVTSISIEWTVNGLSQAPVEYMRTLNAGATDTFTLGSVWLIAGTQVNLTATTVNTLDSNAANNSASRTVFVPLTGTYTVGGSSPSYNRITDAVNALTTYGISGPVTFIPLCPPPAPLPPAMLRKFSVPPVTVRVTPRSSKP